MKIYAREYDKQADEVRDKIPLCDSYPVIAGLSPSDGLIITASSEDEFGNSTTYSIILEREEFEQIKKL